MAGNPKIRQCTKETTFGERTMRQYGTVIKTLSSEIKFNLALYPSSVIYQLQECAWIHFTSLRLGLLHGADDSTYLIGY